MTTIQQPGRPLRRFRLKASWLSLQRLRLASGLILFAYVLSHYLNHGMGLVSLSTMEWVEGYRWWLWHTWVGTILLYGAFVVHIALGLFSIARRTTWRMPVSDAVQIGLGLLIPYFLIDHILATRVMAGQFGWNDSYTNVLRLMWPGLAWSQSALLLMVWVHACIGLQHWLRTRESYARLLPWLVAFAVLVPAFALAGWISAARYVATLSFDRPAMSAEQFSIATALSQQAHLASRIVLAGLVLTIAVAFAVRRLRGTVVVHLPDGRRLRGPRGATLLELIRAAGVPHAAVCGGRARCTTCRVLVLEGAESLHPPFKAEAAALQRIGAPNHVRLACQIRPEGEISVRPLVPVSDQPPLARREDPYLWGVERRITVMFTDLRGFTSLAEQLYAYDAVFLLNRYFEVMSEVVRKHGGTVDKFLGDGIMALFGIEPQRGAGARAAVLAAREMQDALEGLNVEFAAALPHPLRMGIGVHTGPAVLGRVGATQTNGQSSGVALTALGDTVNIASRLEALNKDYGSLAIISNHTLENSGLVIASPTDLQVEVPVRGRIEPMAVFVVRDFGVLQLVEREDAAAP